MPAAYLEALSRLQDRIAPFTYEEVDRIVSGELGVRISKAFAEFDPQPLAAASLAQVHRAYMRDGRAVVVKVQRPNIRDQIVEDLESLEEFAEFMDAHTELGKRYEFGNMLLARIIHEPAFNPACGSRRQRKAWGVSPRKATKMSISPC